MRRAQTSFGAARSCEAKGRLMLDEAIESNGVWESPSHRQPCHIES